MNDSIQTGIQNKTLDACRRADRCASAFDLRTRRDIATARHDLQRDAQRRSRRSRSQHAEAAASIRGAAASGSATRSPPKCRCRSIIEPPISGPASSTRTTAATRKLAYDGSFFRNNVTTLVWDNPARVTDSPTAGPVQGRMALWPNTDMNTVSASGGLKLPGHSRATAYPVGRQHDEQRRRCCRSRSTRALVVAGARLARPPTSLRA